jgi:SAM-dependent methyltransferase
VAPPVIWAMLAQLGAAAITLLNLHFAAAKHVEPIHPVLLHALAAAALGQAFRLPAWWLPINALFVPAALYSRDLAVPRVGFLILLTASILFYWTTYRTRVPLYLSGRRAVRRVVELLPQGQALKVLDLGCGFGGVLAAISAQRPDCELVGLEIAPLPAWIGRLRHRRSAIEVRRKDFWQESLTRFDLVYAFLSPTPMPELWRKVRLEMRPGTLFVSNTFAVSGQVPDLVLPVRGSRSPLYVWRL